MNLIITNCFGKLVHVYYKWNLMFTRCTKSVMGKKSYSIFSRFRIYLIVFIERVIQFGQKLSVGIYTLNTQWIGINLIYSKEHHWEWQNRCIGRII